MHKKSGDANGKSGDGSSPDLQKQSFLFGNSPSLLRNDPVSLWPSEDQRIKRKQSLNLSGFFSVLCF
ncbi:hypothetical protein MRB53_025196 [Persea americana]|nr:hypothetical protein MRB53_025196 [Persea americana]